MEYGKEISNKLSYFVSSFFIIRAKSTTKRGLQNDLHLKLNINLFYNLVNTYICVIWTRNSKDYHKVHIHKTYILFLLSAHITYAYIFTFNFNQHRFQKHVSERFQTHTYTNICKDAYKHILSHLDKFCKYIQHFPIKQYYKKTTKYLPFLHVWDPAGEAHVSLATA